MRKGWLAAPLVLVAAALIFATTATGSGAGAKSGGTFRLGTANGIDSLNPYVAFNQDSYSAFEYIYPILVQYDSKLHFAPFFARSWTALEERQDLDIQDAASRQVERRQAAHSRGRRVDDQYRHQVQEHRRRRHGRSDQPHHGRQGSECDDPRRPLRAGAQSELRARPVPAVLHPPEAHLVAAPRQPRAGPEDVPEQRAGRRLGPLQPRQVPEEPDRALPAQQLLLGHEAEDRGVRAAAVLERRRDGHRAQGARARRDRERPRDDDEDATQGRLRRLGRQGARHDRLHHQLEPAEEEPPRAPQPQGQGGVRPRRSTGRRSSASSTSAPRSSPPRSSRRPPAPAGTTRDLKMPSFDLKLANKILDKVGYKRGPGGIRVANGKKMSYDVITPTDVQSLPRTFQIIQADFARSACS